MSWRFGAGGWRCCYSGMCLSLALRVDVGSGFEDVAIVVVDASVVELREPNCRSQQQVR